MKIYMKKITLRAAFPAVPAEEYGTDLRRSFALADQFAEVLRQAGALAVATGESEGQNEDVSEADAQDTDVLVARLEELYPYAVDAYCKATHDGYGCSGERGHAGQHWIELPANECRTVALRLDWDGSDDDESIVERLS